MTQFAAGMWSFKRENNFAGTAFSSYGAFWLAFGTMELLAALGIYEFQEKAAGVMLIAWGIFTFYMWIPSMKIGKALSLVFLTLCHIWIYGPDRRRNRTHLCFTRLVCFGGRINQ